MVFRRTLITVYEAFDWQVLELVHHHKNKQDQRYLIRQLEWFKICEGTIWQMLEADSGPVSYELFKNISWHSAAAVWSTPPHTITGWEAVHKPHKPCRFGEARTQESGHIDVAFITVAVVHFSCMTSTRRLWERTLQLRMYPWTDILDTSNIISLISE